MSTRRLGQHSKLERWGRRRYAEQQAISIASFADKVALRGSCRGAGAGVTQDLQVDLKLRDSRWMQIFL
jgi:hypothetical protein